MKNKKYLLLAATAALFAACSSDDGIVATQEQAPAQQQAVGFDVYVDRGITRGGVPGELTTDALKTTAGDLQDAGFGVFAYYTDNDYYDQIYRPNFMYNQQVKYESSAWTYTPVKYWPNEFTSANADDNDKVSFFAYAPYYASTATGKVDDNAANITGFSRNTATGDPLVKYITCFDKKNQVDLAFGICAESSWNIKSGSQAMTPGKPWLNVQHPAALNQAMKFTFRHALAGLKVTVDTKANSTTTAAVAAGSKVFVRSITITGIAPRAALNLNNTIKDVNRALWLDYNGIEDMPAGQQITIYDGRKDGSEGTTPAGNEKINFLNPKFVQSSTADAIAAATSKGVTEEPTPLFGKTNAAGTAIEACGNNDYVYIIPTGENVSVTIVYDVMTSDAMLPGYMNDGTNHGSVVTNTITKPITKSGGGDMTFTNGYNYTINLHLGLQQVDFDAEVGAWATGDTGSADLPINN